MDDNKIKRKLKKIIPASFAKVENLRKAIYELTCINKEILWANIFHDTIIDSEWLKNKSFSPGRWGVGYQYLYVLYRVLNEMKPRNILELGMGQTTRMIGQYASYYMRGGVNHIVVEHDQNWINFFNKSFALSEWTTIQTLELEKTAYKDDTDVLSYRGFSEAFKNRKFDLISIDAPFGGKSGGEKYARIDVCRLLPGILNESFVILLDDVNRQQDMATSKEIESILTENEISFKSGYYKGEKNMFVVASSDLGFLTSM